MNSFTLIEREYTVAAILLKSEFLLCFPQLAWKELKQEVLCLILPEEVKQTHWGVYLILHTGFLSNQQWSFLSQPFPSGVFKFVLWPVNKSISQYITYDALSVNDMGGIRKANASQKSNRLFIIMWHWINKKKKVE